VLGIWEKEKSVMEWLEIIELRAMEKDRVLIEPLLEALSEEMAVEDHIQNVKMYRRMEPYIDFSMHLFHESEAVEYTGSQVGLRLASILKTYGIVRQSIWTGLQEH